ncbi:MAG: hypothetical protein PUC00_01270 [Clostridiales bacterium]|nr:hypothetical protein [Clostridiales bacterium]
MKHRLLALCIALLLPLTAVLAEEAPPAPAVHDMGLELMGSSVHYPQLTGLADPQVQAQTNAAIMEAGQINDRLGRMAVLGSAPVKLSVTYAYTLSGDVFSCAMLSDGAVENSRATQVWSAVNVRLSTGQTITFDDLFLDADAATAYIEAYLEEQVAPELSAHLEAGCLTPIPNLFTLSPTGLTLYYDIASFRTLSDKAGTVTILWSELRDHLALGEADVLTSLGVGEHLDFPASAASRLTQAFSGGSLTGIPAAIGQPMQELIDRYALLTDPDIYEGGRMIALEDGAFRQVWILTDALTEDFDQSIVQGIRADRLNLNGLCTGVTTTVGWREHLGAPEATLIVDETRAESWRIVPGSSDYYTFGDYRLRLHADETGVLRSVFLTK